MMDRIFLIFLNMSISASYAVMAVLVLRALLKKAPKFICVILWGMVSLRIIFPFSIESVLSLIPSAETVGPDIMKNPPIVNTGIPVLNGSINPILGELFTPEPLASANPLQILIPVFSVVWVLGITAMLIYTVISYAIVRRRVGTAVLLRDNIYQSENVSSPFVLGIIMPKIYLPFNIREKDMRYVIAHEQAHIQRMDYMWKPIGFLLLAIHWFNPVMWLGYILLCRDIELACDEKVIKSLGIEERADYSEALLAFSVNKRIITACPVAFGEVSVKDRVKTVLNYKKPAFWLIAAAMLACALFAVCFLTNPLDKDGSGIKNISARRAGSDIVEVDIGYYSYPSGGYSVRPVEESEGEYCGDGAVDYDGALGKYRVLIMFGDAEPSQAFAEQYPVGEAVLLKDSTVRILVKRVHPQDHGFALYLGFDDPVTLDTIEDGKFGIFGSSITIPIKIDSGGGNLK